MAIPAQGLTFTWRGVTLQEVQELDISQALQTAEATTVNRFALGRTIWQLTGEITLTGLSMTGLQPRYLGVARPLLITVPISSSLRLVLWHGIARYDGQVVRAGVNGAVTFAHRFTLLSVSSRTGNVEAI